MRLWDAQFVDRGQCLRWQIGPLRIWIERIDDEWHLVTERVPEEDDTLVIAETLTEPEERKWKRWAGSAEQNVVRFLPVLPKRPVVVRPESRFVILPGCRASFFVSIPIWVRILVGEKNPIVLREERSVVLSNSWFGDPLGGELCYALRTRAQRSPEALSPRPHIAVCPVRIENAAGAELDFERLCLRVAHLRIYAGTPHLWTNEVHVTHKGEQYPSQIDYLQEPPSMAGSTTLLSEARQPAARGLLQKTFSTLKAFSPI